MANAEIIAYIRANSSKFSKPLLTQTLIAGGWPAADVAAAFLEIEVPPLAAPVPPPAPVAPRVPPTVTPATPPVIQPAVIQPIHIEPVVSLGNSIPPTPSETTTTTNFLAEMEAHRKEAQSTAYAPIIEGNTQIRPSSTAYLHSETNAAASVEQKGIIGMLIKTGLVKTEKQANIVMIGFIIVVLGIAAWLLL